MIEVVAAMIRDGERALLCRRPEGKNQGGMWEFPGGKIEAGETGEAALERECCEELGVELEVGDVLADATQEYPDRTVHLTLYAARIRCGEPRMIEHSDMLWVPMEELHEFELCPADRQLIERLGLAGGD